MSKTLTFVDRVKLYVSSGDGGDGCSSFRREKYVPRGGPDGGDGGHGGNVYLRADKDVDSLLDLHYRPHQRAEHGGKGRGQRCHGRNGSDLYVRVPPGTEARMADSGDWMGDVLQPGDTLMVAQGGKGGRGNSRFATSTDQAPRKFTEGTAGEQRILRLELKLVAEVGLVGYPNAGKSTLLRAISGARPKTAPYPFTTLHPVIGTVMFDDYQSIRVADIPGLIDGAHEGIGLGHDFLRHIERTQLLLFVLDMAGTDGRSPADDYASLREELHLYREELDHRPYLVVGNKMDKEESELFLEEFLERGEERPLLISAEKGDGIAELKSTLCQALNDLPQTPSPEGDRPSEEDNPTAAASNQ